MSDLAQKNPPIRESRLQACIVSGRTLGETRGKPCLANEERTFSQNSICLLLPAMGIMSTIPNSVVLMHGAVGCGSSAHCSNAGVRGGNSARWGTAKDCTWLSTALSETEVIGGGEEKLIEAIQTIDKTLQPALIFVVSGCVPGIIGDDIDMVVQQLQPDIQAKLLPVHCEGFKTKIWATAYDAIYHAIGRVLLQDTPENLAIARPEQPTVNLMNVGSMGRVDEVELERLLQALGLNSNIFPVFSKPENFYRLTHAQLSVSTCPTHDDYLLQYLKEKYQIPYLLQHMPIGIKNTGLWLMSIAEHFALGKEVKELIAKEEAALQAALEPMKELFAGKKVLVSAGEFRALSTAILLAELGFEVVAIRSYHHDEFALSEYEKLIETVSENIPLNIANCQPFEEANLIKRLKPDIFLGHMNANSTAAKLGVATNVIYNTGLQFLGYQGAFQLARRLYRQLSNPRFNQNLSQWVKSPYQQEWYDQSPFTYIKQAGGEG